MDYKSSEIINFISNFKHFSKHLEKQKAFYYQTKFDSFFNGFNTLKQILNKYNAHIAEDYNIFNILNINTAETKTHTPFLVNLLHPQGSHSQNNLFLKSFITSFIPLDKQSKFILNNYNDYSITQEKTFYDGRIDIYIESLDSINKFGIIIENKIFAYDQFKQVDRYYNFLRNKNLTSDQMLIIYLTIDGSLPSSYSIDNELMLKLKNDKTLICLSYNTHIVNWLSKLINEIKAPNVILLLKQYIDTISNLKQ